MSPEPIARAIYDAAQGAAADDEDLNGGVLMGFYAIAEWAAQDGQTFLTQHSLGADDEDLAGWRSLGFVEWAKGSLGPESPE